MKKSINILLLSLIISFNFNCEDKDDDDNINFLVGEWEFKKHEYYNWAYLTEDKNIIREYLAGQDDTNDGSIRNYTLTLIEGDTNSFYYEGIFYGDERYDFDSTNCCGIWTFTEDSIYLTPAYFGTGDIDNLGYTLIDNDSLIIEYVTFDTGNFKEGSTIYYKRKIN